MEQGPVTRGAFYLPGVVSGMARIVVTATCKGTRSRLGAAALRSCRCCAILLYSSVPLQVCFSMHWRRMLGCRCVDTKDAL